MSKIRTICAFLVRLVVALIAIFFGCAFLFQWNNPQHSLLINNANGFDMAPNFRGEKGQYFKNKDNLWIHYDEYLPSGNAKGILLWLHGFENHAGHFADVAQRVADETNLIVLTQDHQGWGLSEGDRLYFESVSHLTDDFHQLMEMKKKEHNIANNVFCLGHSFSSNLLVWDHFNSLQSGRSPLCQGLVLSALGISLDPALESFLEGPFGQLLDYLSDVFPKMIVLKMIGVAEVASSLPDYQEAWYNDPLVHAFGRARTGHNLFQIVHDNAKNDINKLSLPFFVFTGTEDQMVPPQSLKNFAETAASKDKSFKLYAGDRHSVLNDKHANEAVTDISNWLKKHIQ